MLTGALVLALVLCVTALGWFKRVESRQIAVDATGWYLAHAGSSSWIRLFAMLAGGAVTRHKENQNRHFCSDFPPAYGMRKRARSLSFQ